MILNFIHKERYQAYCLTGISGGTVGEVNRHTWYRRWNCRSSK